MSTLDLPSKMTALTLEPDTHVIIIIIVFSESIRSTDGQHTVRKKNQSGAREPHHLMWYLVFDSVTYF